MINHPRNKGYRANEDSERDKPRADSRVEQRREEKVTSQQVILLVVGHAVTVITEQGPEGIHHT